jgi:hypothetical protein
MTPMPKPKPVPAQPAAPDAVVDLREVADLLHTATTRLQVQDGKAVAGREITRDRSAELARLTKELLYLAHLCKKAETAVLDEYWVVKGFDPNGING